MREQGKLGLMIQLFKQTWEAFEHQFKVEGNKMFTELLHMLVFQFDSLVDFYKDELFSEPLLKNIFPCLEIVIKTLNGIEKNTERYLNPFTESLF